MVFKGLPVSVIDHHDAQRNVDRARTGRGTLLATGALNVDADDPTAIRLAFANGVPPEADLTAALIESAWHEVFAPRRDRPGVRRLLSALAEHARTPLPIHLLHHHNAFIDADEQERVLQVDSGVATLLGLRLEDRNLTTEQPARLSGARGVTALALGASLARLAGYTLRDSLHFVFDLFGELEDVTRSETLRLLAEPILDAGNSLRIALRTVTNATEAEKLEQVDIRPFAGVDMPSLLKLGERLASALPGAAGASASAERRHALLEEIDYVGSVSLQGKEVWTEVHHGLSASDSATRESTVRRLLQATDHTYKWRDKWVTWMIGQARVDIPYNQEAVIDLLETPMEDVDAKRALVNELIARSYDYELEGANLRRLYSWALEHDVHLVAGRLSRAFGNQAHLFSASAYVENRSAIIPALKSLRDASAGLEVVQTHITRIAGLVEQEREVPWAQLVGAIDLAEEAVVSFQSSQLEKLRERKSSASALAVARWEKTATTRALLDLHAQVEALLGALDEVRRLVHNAPRRDAAFVVFLQRLHPAETILLAQANANREVHPGKEEDLRDLGRIGGHNLYASQGAGSIAGPDGTTPVHWISAVGDWIEAIPLFIKERVITRTTRVGGEDVEVESIETEVDQDAMEVFFRLHAEYWARNLDNVAASEHVALARELILASDPKLKEEAESVRRTNPRWTPTEAFRRLVDSSDALRADVALVAAAVAVSAEQQAANIALRVEQNDLDRASALRQTILSGDATCLISRAMSVSGRPSPSLADRCAGAASDDEKRRMDALLPAFSPLAGQKTRPTPNLHILTTESAGMTEGYVQTWLEEEMALFNVVKGCGLGLEEKVEARLRDYRKRLDSVARRVIREFGMEVVVQEVMAEQKIAEANALGVVMMSYKPVAEEIARLAVLIETEEWLNGRPVDVEDASDPAAVDAEIAAHLPELEALSRPIVAANNGRAFEEQLAGLRAAELDLSENEALRKLIASEEDYASELAGLVRSEARKRVFGAWQAAHPERFLAARARNYIREHTGLARSTARKEVVAEAGEQALTLDPRYHYQATGGNKRYNLLYTPSRVNLGEKERASVAVWRQWVGGADQRAAQAGFAFYSLVNEGGVEERPALAYAEIQKTSENALCVTHFAGSNALGLLVNSVGEGDVEDMADQMNLRGDRLVLPAGEGYGGYCVPKDGLFLAFVLSLTNDVKLRQMGIPEPLHDGVMQLAREAVARRGEFSTDAEWQAWAGNALLTEDVLASYFRMDGPVPVFQITRIGQVIQRLGGPWPAAAGEGALPGNLSARWGVERMIVFAEQVNRFMVFYKAWMIYQCLAEARAHHSACPDEHEARIGLTAEYKPVQDVRYSTGLRLFELFSGTGDHLFHSLDETGQNLAYLLLHGFDPDSTHPIGKRAARAAYLTYASETQDTTGLEDQLRSGFPAHGTPADLVLTSVTLCSTQDMLFYVSDTRMDQLAEQAKLQLSDAGMTEKQMTADAAVHGGTLRAWSGLRHLAEEDREALIREIGGHIHPLVLKLRGPGRDYVRDVQGIDVLNAGIPFPQLLALLDDMPRLVALMLMGNPNSALAIADGGAGKQRRALVERDITAFFATCTRYGRRGVYQAIGWGRDQVERLRLETERKQDRAKQVFDAYRAVVEAGDEPERRLAARHAIETYSEVVSRIIQEDEPGRALRTEEKLMRYKKWRQGDAFISLALSKLRAGLSAGQLDPGTWLAGLGGTLLVIAEDRGRIAAMLETIRRGSALVAELASTGSVILPRHGQGADPFTASEEQELIAALVRPRFIPQMQRFAQEMLVETSSKAVEVAAIEALERRKALKQRAARARALGERANAFDKHLPLLAGRSVDALCDDARRALEEIDEAVVALYGAEEDDTRERLTGGVHSAFGCFLAASRRALERLARDVWPESDAAFGSLLARFIEDVRSVFTGREIVLEVWKRLAGGYEEMGGLARLAEHVRADPPALDRVARVVELYYTAFALGQTLEFAVSPAHEIDERHFWKRITDFFAETINDHWYDYLPWAYARGIGFAHLSREALYDLAVRRHAWLYRFLRRLIVSKTELARVEPADVDHLLGNYLAPNQVVAIGADGADETERAWRAYNQLRELAFIKSDGFAVPPVFAEFDPDLIAASERVNLVFLLPVGRTHISRAFREGPTLRRLMAQHGEPRTNLLVTRYEPLEEDASAGRPVLRIRSAHLTLDETEFRLALARHRGLEAQEIDAEIVRERATGRLTDKGIRVAVRFVRNGRAAPVLAAAVVPFHGLPAFESGALERAGFPATVQSLLFHDITYDKSLYPAIFTPDTGVHLPAEHDWLLEYGAGKTASEILDAIENGTGDGRFEGLRAFALQHGLVLIKGAAESGARNLKVFQIGLGNRRLDEEELITAVRFVFDVGKKQNVVIQEALLTSPEAWASEDLLQSFVDRQILEWNRPVFRDRLPRSQIYGSLRVVASSSHPALPYDTSFLITLNSLQVATNVGRGGTLEILSEEAVRPEFRASLLEGLRAEAPKVMAAMARFAAQYSRIFEAARGRPVEKDLRGVSYAWPPYLMLDYLVTPVFARSGKMVDIEGVYDDHGVRTGSRLILEDADGRFVGEITGWRFVHLEPNVGIGLWDRYNLREEERERTRSASEGRPMDWVRVGASDRVVLRNFVLAGAQYLRALDLAPSGVSG